MPAPVESRPALAGLTIGVDAHVLTGKFQGTRTVLQAQLRTLAPQLAGRRLVVYVDDVATARAQVDAPELEYRSLDHAGSANRLLRVFPRMFRRDAVDVGLFQYIAPLTGKHAVYVHDILPLTHPHLFSFASRLKTRIFYGLSVRRAILVLTVSDASRCSILKHFAVAQEKVLTVPLGPSFPAEAFAAPRVESSIRTIMTVGRIEQRKNIPLLVAAFRRAAVPDVRLLIVGSNDAGFEWCVPDDPMIEQRQGMDDAALAEMYRGASLFVYPSSAEGFGIPLLDALLFGIPTISSDRTSLPEVGGDLATYFNPDASDAVDRLATLIRGHFGDAPIAAPSLAERDALAQTFSWERASGILLDAIDAAAIRAGIRPR